MKMIPLAGGFIGGAFDAAACRIVGRQAKNLFYTAPQIGHTQFVFGNLS